MSDRTSTFDFTCMLGPIALLTPGPFPPENSRNLRKYPRQAGTTREFARTPARRAGVRVGLYRLTVSLPTVMPSPVFRWGRGTLAAFSPP